MNVGLHPFSLDKGGQLNLTFSPSLAGWLFDKKGEYSFNFLSKIRVTYHNPKRKNTFGSNGAKITKIILFENDQPREVNSATLSQPYALKIRSREIKQIDIFLQ
jgi:hypothetical protein